MKKLLFSLMMALTLAFAGLVQAQVSLPYDDGFENGLGEWTMSACHTSTGVTTSSSYVHSGSSAFAFHWSTTPPQYLISPEFTGATGGLNVEFYYKAGSTGSFSESFQVGYSISTNAVEDFTFGEEITAAAGADWAVYSNTFPAGTKYVAVKCTSDDALYFCVDDFAFTAVGGEMVEAELTVHDATTYNSYVPLYGTWADAYQKCEMVYPASELSAMRGGEINAITYYLSSPASEPWEGTWQFFMYEVDNATISTFYGDNRTVVYEGLLDGTGETMTVNLDTPYTYNGGNLLIGVYQIVPGNWKSAYFYGENVTGASVEGYSSTGLDYITPTQRNFLPKTTFGYTYMAPEVEIVNAIEINGFAAPVWGGSLPEDNTYVPEDANYTIVESGWSSYYPNRGETKAQARVINPEEIVNDPDRAYYMYFLVEPNEGYGFNYSTVAYLNGDDNMWDETFTNIQQDNAVLVTVDFFPYEDGLHTLSTYGVGDNEYESIDRLLIERPNGAWMEPFHFQLYNDGSEDVNVVWIDFLHTNQYFSMVADSIEYPFIVEATGLEGAVDLYINTNIDWTDNDVINSLLAVNTNERSTHLYPIIAAPYEPYCPDVFEKAYPLGNVTDGTQWSMTTEEMWMEQNPEPEYELHNNYHMPFTDDPYNIADGYDAVIKFTVDRAMMLKAWVSGEQSPTADAENAKVALYTEDFYGRPGPMADNNYTERPFDPDGTGGGGSAGPFDVVIGDEESTTTLSYVPFFTLYEYSIAEALYLPEELIGAGVTTAPMTSLSWYANNAPGYEQQGLTIWMANVTDTELTSTLHPVTGMTKVYTGSMTPAVGWNEFLFNEGTFAWDGHSSVLIFVQRNNGVWNSTVNWRAQNAGFKATTYAYQDDDPFDVTVANTANGYSAPSQNRSIIKMKSNGGRIEVGSNLIGELVTERQPKDPQAEYKQGAANANQGNINSILNNRGTQAYGMCVYAGSWPTGFITFDVDAPGAYTLINSTSYYGLDYCNGYYYACDKNSYILYKMDLEGNVLSSVNINSTLTDGAWNASNNTMYAMYGTNLYTVNLNTGEMATLATSTNYFRAIACNANGQLYAIMSDGNLYQVNATTGALTLVGATGCTPAYAQSMAFDKATGNLYWCFSDSYNDNFMQVNPTTGVASLLLAGTGETCGLCFPMAETPEEPEEPEMPEITDDFSAGPVIYNLNILPGTYYLVASSTEGNYRVNINVEDLPCPEQAIAVYPPDNADDIEPASVTLKWHLSPYCTEYRLYFSTMYWPDDNPDHPQTIVIDWTDQLAEEYTVTGLWHNTNYFWRVDQRTNGGEENGGCTTIGNVFGFTTTFNIPQQLVAVPEMIFEGDTTTLMWDPVVDRTYRYYFIYQDSVKIGQTTVNQIGEHTYDVAGLAYNMDGYVFNVAAVYDEGISNFSNDAIVKVSGYSNTTGINGYVYEQDSITPIEGATVTITGTDEFGNSHTYNVVTDANGYYHVQVYVGHYTVAVANKEGYVEVQTTHPLPFDVVHQEQVDNVNFIMDEVFYAPANVCAEKVFVEGEEGDTLVHIWWDFNFYTALVEDFEDFDNTPFQWENSAQYPWTVTTTNPYEGTYCLKSGGAGVNSVISDMVATVDVPNDGFISFYVKPSCESGWDYGYFYIDGVEKGSFTGQGNWVQKKYPVTAGSHTFKWRYQKDSSYDYYDDCIYIDYITFNEQPEPAVPGMTYDFEDSSMQGWTTIDADGDGYSWYVASEIMATGYGHDGSNDCVLSQSYYGGVVLYPDNYFVSPQVALGGILKFYACGQDASYAAEHFGVAVSTTNNTSASAFTTIQEWTMSAKSVEDNGKRVEDYSRSGRVQGNWYEFTVDLSAYAGQNGYVAIRHFNCSDMFYLDVDDITISDPNRDEARALHHFRVYRTDCYNDGPYTSENTELLASAWMPDYEYYDVSWPYAEPGVYKYGVSAVYDGNRDGEDDEVVVYPALPRESEIVWSNTCGPCIDKDMYLDTIVTLTVVLNSLDNPEGTVVTFVNTNEGEQYNHPMDPITLDQTGYYVFPHFRKGNYNITVEHDGYFTIVDYQEIWSATDLRYVLIEKIFNVKDLYVSRTGWAMWEPRGIISNPDDSLQGRHLEYYKVMCESIDHEPIFNVNTEHNFCQVATDELVEGDRYVCKVAAIYSTGMSDYEEVEWVYEPCENYAGSVSGVVNDGGTITWEYPGGGQPGPGEASTFSENCDEGMPAEWTTLDVDGDGYTWVSSMNPGNYHNAGVDLTGNGHNGSAAFVISGSWINQPGQALTPDNYLVSPQVTLVAGSTFSFWACAQDANYPADHFGVAISDNGTSDWTMVNEWTMTSKSGGTVMSFGRNGEMRAQGNWYQYTVDLSDYVGQKYIAIRHFNCTDQFILNVDDIELTTARNRIAPAEAVLSSAGPTLTGMLSNFGDREGWLTYDELGVYYNAYGFNGQTFAMGNLHPASQMAAYDGQSLTKVSFSPYCNVSGNIEIYQGGTDEPGTLVYSQAFTATGAGETGNYVDFDLTTPVVIDGTQNLWVVVTGETYVDYPFSVVNSSAYDQYTFAYLNGYGWYGLSEVGGSGAWMLRAFVEEGTPTPIPSGNVLGAMIFVDGEWEAFVPYPTNTYTYEGDGEVCVRIVYGGDAELPDNNFYYAMSCMECAVDAEMCLAGDPIYADVDINDQVHIWWGNDRSDKIVKYNVYRASDNSRYLLIGDVAANRSGYNEYFDNPGEGVFYYQVTAVYSNGCESAPAVSGIDPTVDYVVIGVTGIGEIDGNVNLFPNPTKSNVTIQAQGMHRITVVSVLGQVVFDTELKADEYTMNLGQFNAGMYLVRVYTENGVAVKRVTVIQ